MAYDIDLKTVSLILATVMLLGIGQVLFKYAANEIDFGNIRSFLSPSLFAALVVYGFATLAWLFVLSKVPLSVAFPFFGLSFLIVPLFSALILGEKLHWSTFVGGAIIMLGIAICAGRK